MIIIIIIIVTKRKHCRDKLAVVNEAWTEARLCVVVLNYKEGKQSQLQT